MDLFVVLPGIVLNGRERSLAKAGTTKQYSKCTLVLSMKQELNKLCCFYHHYNYTHYFTRFSIIFRQLNRTIKQEIQRKGPYDKYFGIQCTRTCLSSSQYWTGRVNGWLVVAGACGTVRIVNVVKRGVAVIKHSSTNHFSARWFPGMNIRRSSQGAVYEAHIAYWSVSVWVLIPAFLMYTIGGNN